MPVYLVAEISIEDPKTYAEYQARVPATVEKFGGRYLVRGGTITALEGGWRPERLVILEFPSAEHLRRWADSAEYQEIAPFRLRSTRTRSVGVEGCAPAPPGPAR